MHLQHSELVHAIEHSYVDQDVARASFLIIDASQYVRLVCVPVIFISIIIAANALNPSLFSQATRRGLFDVRGIHLLFYLC